MIPEELRRPPMRFITDFANRDNVFANARIGNAEYQRLAEVTKATASRDHLEALTKAGALKKIGSTGKGTYCTLGGKGLAKGSKGSSGPGDGQGSRRAQRAQPQRKRTPGIRGKRVSKARKKGTP